MTPFEKEWGIAVQSKFLGVGAVVPWAKAGVGAVATQSYANTAYGPKGTELMDEGKIGRGNTCIYFLLMIRIKKCVR